MPTGVAVIAASVDNIKFGEVNNIGLRDTVVVEVAVAVAVALPSAVTTVASDMLNSAREGAVI
jgi:hypothetical protein